MDTIPAEARPGTDAGAGAPSVARQMLNKVPEVTLYFWIIKILCTTVGETASDYLSENVGLGLTKTTFLTGAALLVASSCSNFEHASTCHGSTG